MPSTSFALATTTASTTRALAMSLRLARILVYVARCFGMSYFFSLSRANGSVCCKAEGGASASGFHLLLGLALDRRGRTGNGFVCH
jgi:hypothetical protein